MLLFAVIVATLETITLDREMVTKRFLFLMIFNSCSSTSCPWRATVHGLSYRLKNVTQICQKAKCAVL